MKHVSRSLVLVLGLFSFQFSVAQTIQKLPSAHRFIPQAERGTLPAPTINAVAYEVVELHEEQLFQSLQGLTYREGELNGFVAHLDLPMPDGTSKAFSLKRNQTMHPQLNQAFPEILTGDAYALDDSGAFGKWDITPQGFHGMIFIPGQSTVFIDPYTFGETTYYMVYRKKDFRTDKLMSCDFVEVSNPLKEEMNVTKSMFGSCALRTYRLALSATAEYTTFHGGTVAQAAAAQVTTMNRVNGVYEKDIAITMTIVPNNDVLIFTNTATDGFTNGTPGTMINQNQTITDNAIGSANYDIGHVFGTNSGGLAGLGVVCTGSQKARGVTGSSAPIGDPFDIDYVAHEMGHQFGGNHTQNNACNSVSAARREPGSASTIMGYAGICAPNVQNNSDDYFHGYSLQEIGNEVLSTGHQCEQITTLNNSAPVISVTNGNISIPANTPFALTATATDADGDVLTYLWEQMDNEASTQPPLATATGGPNFRSFDPSTSPTRYFPNLQALAADGPFTWEVLPSVSRTMDFRVSVRDNHAVGSCNDYTDVTVSTVASAGPFVVSYPSATGINWSVNATQTITWDVANTNTAPINCSTVRILLSVDGGVTYPIELSAGTENDGSFAVTVPNNPTTTARVMVISSTGTFFDISDNNFTISTCTPASLPNVTVSQPACFGEDAVLTIASGSLNESAQWSWFAGSCNGTPVGTGTSVTVSPSVSTTYYAVGTGACASSECASVTVNVPATISNQVTQAGALLTAVQGNAQYQWVDCTNDNTPVAGATSQSFQPTALVGSYAVEVIQNGCSVVSPCFNINQTGLNDGLTWNWHVYPNPADAYVTVSWENQAVQRVVLTDALGKYLWSEGQLIGTQVDVPMQAVSSGLYFIRLEGAFGVVAQPIQK